MSRPGLTVLALVALGVCATEVRAQRPTNAVPASPGEASPAPHPSDELVSPPVAASLPVAPAPPPAALVAPAPARAPAHVPLARQWWFWAGLGGAAVAAVLAGIALSPRQPYTGNAQPGVIQAF